MGRIRTKVKEQNPVDLFPVVDDFKLKMTLIALADRLDQQARDHVYRVYHDPRVLSVYQAIRTAGIYEKGGKHRRKLLEIPDQYVWDFLETVMGALYGPDWWKQTKALKHELVRPWWVVKSL